MKSPWKTLSSRIAYQTPYIKIREDQVIRPDGKPGIYSVLDHPPAVFVVALTDKDEIYLVDLYRYPTQQMSLELPAGSTDREDVISSAKRELQEETGLTAQKFEKIGEFQSYNGIANELSVVVIATGLTQGKTNSQKEEGIESVKKYTILQIMDLIKTGKLTDGQSIAALTQALLYLKKIN